MASTFASAPAQDFQTGNGVFDELTINAEFFEDLVGIHRAAAGRRAVSGPAGPAEPAARITFPADVSIRVFPIGTAISVEVSVLGDKRRRRSRV